MFTFYLYISLFNFCLIFFKLFTNKKYNFFYLDLIYNEQNMCMYCICIYLIKFYIHFFFVRFIFTHTHDFIFNLGTLCFAYLFISAQYYIVMTGSIFMLRLGGC